VLLTGSACAKNRTFFGSRANYLESNLTASVTLHLSSSFCSVVSYPYGRIFTLQETLNQGSEVIKFIQSLGTMTLFLSLISIADLSRAM